MNFYVAKSRLGFDPFTALRKFSAMLNYTEPGTFPKKGQIRKSGGGPPVLGVGHKNFDFWAPLGILQLP